MGRLPGSKNKNNGEENENENQEQENGVVETVSDGQPQAETVTPAPAEAPKKTPLTEGEKEVIKQAREHFERKRNEIFTAFGIGTEHQSKLLVTSAIDALRTWRLDLFTSVMGQGGQTWFGRFVASKLITERIDVEIVKLEALCE